MPSKKQPSESKKVTTKNDMKKKRCHKVPAKGHSSTTSFFPFSSAAQGHGIKESVQPTTDIRPPAAGPIINSKTVPLFDKTTK